MNLKMTESEILEYLDRCIRFWREKLKSDYTPDEILQKSTMASCYIDCFQSVRVSLFGETLSKEDK